MTEEQINTFEKLIMAQKKEIFDKLCESSRELAIHGDILDEEFCDRENQLSFRFKSREKLFLQKIEDALERIKDDSYGVCDDCGANISIKRLMARPMANKCISCKEAEEQEEVNVQYERKSKSLGKKMINTGNQDNVISFKGFSSKKSKEKFDPQNYLSLCK